MTEFEIFNTETNVDVLITLVLTDAICLAEEKILNFYQRHCDL